VYCRDEYRRGDSRSNGPPRDYYGRDRPYSGWKEGSWGSRIERDEPNPFEASSDHVGEASVKIDFEKAIFVHFERKSHYIFSMMRFLWKPVVETAHDLLNLGMKLIYVCRLYLMLLNLL
jgi:hypothetical protein